MAIETLENPKPQHLYTWRCCNKNCAALLRGIKTDAECVVYTAAGDLLEYKCPHCKWHTTVPE